MIEDLSLQEEPLLGPQHSDNNNFKVRESFKKSSSRSHRDSVDPNNNLEQLLMQVDTKIGEYKQEQAQEMVSFSTILFTYADRKDRTFFYVGFMCAILCGLGLPSFVFLFGNIADSFDPRSPPEIALEHIKKVAKALVLIGGGVWLCSFIWFTFLIIASERIGQKTKAHYLEAILKQDITWFDQTNTSELSSRLGKEVQAIQKAIGEKLGTILMAFSMSFAGMFFAFFKGWFLSLLLLCYFPIMFAITYFVTTQFQRGFTENLKAYGQSAGYAEQALNAIRIVFAFGQEETEIRNYEKYLERAKKTGIKTHLMGSLAIGLLFFGIYTYYSYSFFVGSFLVTGEKINSLTDQVYTGGDVCFCFLGVVYGMFAIGLATPNIKALIEGQIAGKMAYDIILRKPIIEIDKGDPSPLKQMSGEIEFRNVDFSYPTRKEQKILDNFSMKFEQGKTTAIVGTSGSGKSTIVQLIERFYDPDCGQVLIDGQDLKELNLRKYRQNIGYVGQEPVLFNMSIKENILYGNPDATDEEVIQALKSANAWDFINDKMKEKGIHTNVGNSGGQLSGGQKQRLAIARAFIKSPKILLLDEATSALDKKNEKEVQIAIDKIRQELGGEITTIVIAHRLSTIKDADKIIVMNKGKIVEIGNHDMLLEKYPEGIYAKFVKEQEQAEDNNQHETPLKEETLDSQFSDIKSNHSLKKIAPHLKQSVSVKKLQDQQIMQEIEQKDLSQELKLKDYLALQRKQSFFKRLLSFNRPKINIYLGILASIVLGSLMPIFGGLLSKMLFVLMNVTQNLDEVRSDSNKYCGVMMGLAVVALLSGFSQKFLFGIIGENVTHRIRKTLYRKIVEKHLGWFDIRENAPGILTSTLSSDAQVINGVSTEGLASILEAISAVITGLVIGFIFSWKMSLVLLGIMPFMSVMGFMNAMFQKGISITSEETTKMADLLAGDAIINYKTVASFAHENKLVSDYSMLIRGAEGEAVKKSMLIGFTYGFSQFILYGSQAAIFYAGAQFMVHFHEDPLYMFISVFAIMFASIEIGQSQQFGPDMGKARAAAQKIFGVIDQPTEITALENPTTLDKQRNQNLLKRIDPMKFVGEIEFHDVWFRYPTRKNDWILKGLNLKIRPNETVALVGESGCGKSTLVSLIMRFYDVDGGHISLDGVDIREIDLVSLRQLMGLVMQEPTLFNYTIQENILYGKLDATNGEIREAAQVANALEFIESSKQQTITTFSDSSEQLLNQLQRYEDQLVKEIGLQEYMKKKEILDKIFQLDKKKGKFTSIEGDIDNRSDDKKDILLHSRFKLDCGMRGSKLSGGQKQRIAIARAIIRKPKILILDEATSALDEESQKKVQIALDNIMQERTSIVIAHRLSTVEKCDRIVVLEGGRLVEEGRFDELKQKDGGFFAQLAQGLQNKKD